MSGPDFLHAQRRTARRGAGSNLRLMPVMAVAFVAALVTFRPFPGETAALRAPADALSARFALCDGGGARNCVVDGDTFRFAGDTYRVADIDTPETHPARCAGEAALGAAATGRLRAWLNEGAFSLERAARDSDRYGRKLRIVTRGGTSAGSVLVAEGLARPWEGARRPWCQGSGF
ncbi:MAG: thermonuclease family protein [Sphingopyxis sp.]|nr:thermonuclease family protein [Sphingopyxis sp.]